MKRHLLSLILFFGYYLSNAQTPCTPVPGGAGETCGNPCWVCLNPYFGNTFNFQSQGASPSNFCPPNTSLDNDQYFLFIPQCFGVGAITFTITSNSGCQIQAAIYKAGQCNTLPLECNSGFSGSISGFGGSVNYQAGMNYILMIDGYGGAQCFFSVEVDQPSCISKPPNPFPQNWSPMTSNAPNPIPCANPIPDVWYNFSVPTASGAQKYHWWVKQGDATIKKGNLQGNDITINGTTGTSTQVNFNAPGTIEICCQASNGCDSTNELCKVFTVLTPPDRDTTVFICDEDATWPGTNVPNAPSPLPGAPFAPGTYAINLKTAQNCPYVFNVTVNKLPPNQKDLGDKVLCETETFTYCGKTYNGTQSGQKTFICFGTGSTPPTSCDTTIMVNIIGIVITPVLTSSGTNLDCPGDKITLDACGSTFTPNNATVSYEWYKDGVLISGATGCTYDATDAGVYKVKVNVSFNGKSCSKEASKTITSSFPPPPTPANVPQTGPFCNNQNYTFTISNSNSNFTYSWTLNGNPVGNGTSVNVTATAPTFTLCVKTTNACNIDTNKCYTFSAIVVPDRDTTVFICDEDATWPGTNVPNAPNPLPGAPFAPGFHKVTLTNSQGCNYDFNITVNKYPPLTKDLGDKVLCETESFTYCGQTFLGSNGGQKQFNCAGNGNAPPQSCDTTILVNIIGIIITPQIIPSATVLNCPGDVITLDACGSTVLPNGATTTYKWYKDNVLISGATGCSITLTAAGLYKVEVTGTFNGKSCTKNATVNIIQNFPPNPTPANVPQKGPFCNNQSYTFTISNYNPVFTYEWTLNGQTIGQGSSINTVVNAPSFTLCVKTTNVCNKDTNVCYSFPVITVPDRDTVVFICDEDPFWPGTNVPNAPNPLPGAPFSPGQHVVILTTPQGCNYNFNITVNQYPPNVKDLGDRVLCESESFTYCANTFFGNNPGLKQFTCQGVGNQPPRSCDTTITVNIIGLIINPNLTASATNLSCPDDEIIISACNADLQPSSAIATYKWYKNNILISGASFCDITTKDPGTYKVEITLNYNGKICSKTAQITITQNYPPKPTAAIINTTGPFCDGNTYNISVTNANPAFTYNWFLNGALVSTGNPGSITVSAPDDEICIQTVNVCNKDTSKCYTIQVLDNPTEPIVASLDSVCQGGNLQFCVTNPQPGSTYSWQLPSFATIINQTATCVTVKFGNDPGEKVVCAINKNKCGSVTGCKVVYVHYNPDVTAIQGPPIVCKGDYSAYSIPFDPAATEYVWTFNGGNIINGQGTYEIDVEWTTLKDTASVCVYAKGVCKNSKQVCFKAKIVQAPKQPIVSGTSFICASNTNYIYKNDIIDPNANYTWSQTGGTIVNKTKDSIIINWLNETTGIVKIDADNVCGNKNDDIEVKVYKIPNAQAGDDQKICQFETTINTKPSLGNGTWTILNKPANSNASLSTSNAGTSFLSNACGNYDMIWKEDNNGCFDLDTVNVNVSLPPTVSNVSVICDTSKTFYTVSFSINGCGSSYIVKNLINGSQKIVNVAPFNFVSDPLPDSSTFRFVVYGDNECVSDTISGAKLCSCPTNAGEMSNAVLSACEDGSVQAVHKGNQVLQIDDTFEYILHTNPGTQLGNIIDRNKNGIFKFISPPMKLENTYYISYVAGNDLGNGQVDLINDLCLSIAPGQPVVFHGYPKPIAIPDFTICGDSATIEVVANAPKGIWNLISGTGIAVFEQQSNSKTYVKVSKYGSYLFEWTSDNFGCTGKDDVKVDFFPDDLQVSAPLKSCDSLGLSYTMKFTISGGQPPYKVNGVQIAGNQYISSPILAGDPYDFYVSDLNDCESQRLTGVRECDCIAEVFSINTNDVCENETATVTGTGKKGGKDISEFLLTTGVDLKLPSTKILQRNQSGLFTFNTGMTCGIPYYAHYIIARQDPFNPQQVKLNDTCLADISKPIVFNCTPKVDAGIKDSICGQTYTLNGSWTLGNGTWSTISGPGQSNISTPNTTSTDINVSTCGLYKYQLFADNNGCKNQDTVEIDFSNPPTDVNRIATCNNIFTEYVVTFSISGCGGPYKVLGMNGGTVTGTSFTSNPIPSDTIQYQFEIIDAFGCKTTINGTKNCQCLNTEVGTMPSNLLKVCIDDNGNGFVQATNDNNSKFDPNDTYEYILTDTCSSKKVGVIFDRNKTGQFTLVPPMKFGKTYYIAFGVGDSLNNGQLNLVNNKCLGFVWQPVVFYKCPKAVCPPTDTIYCGLQHNLKATASVGVGKWTVISKPAGSTVTIGNQNSAGTSLKVSEFGDYTLQWLEDNAGYRDSCSVSFKFIYIPAPKVVGQPVYVCNAKDTTYTVSYELASSGGNLILLPGSTLGTFTGQTFTSNPIKSDINYQFSIKTESSCDTLYLDGGYHCYCKATAGNAKLSSACEGADTTFNLSNILTNEDFGGKWESLQLVSGFDANNATFRTKGVPSGVYLFRYGIESKKTPPSCLGDTVIVKVVVNPTPFADAGIDKLINCKVPTTELGGNQSTSGANINYVWTGPANTKPTSKFTIASNGGAYQLKVYNSVTGCYDLDTVNVIAKTSKPEADYIVKVPSCKGKLDAGVTMKIINGEFPLTYKMNGVKVLWNSGLAPLDLGIKVPGIYPIELEDVNGCKTKDSIVVPDGENFSVDLGPDLLIEFGDSAIIEAILKKITKDSIYKIEWKPNIPTLPNNPLAVVAKPELWHEYCLTIYNKAYCKAEDCVLVSIQNDKEVFIPNIFTPGDEDGTNDFFTLYGNKNVEQIETLQIFDRWGNLLFKRDNFNHSDPSLGWDGRFQNKDMNPGVYVYWTKVRFKDGSNKVYKGDVTILRK